MTQEEKATANRARLAAGVQVVDQLREIRKAYDVLFREEYGTGTVGLGEYYNELFGNHDEPSAQLQKITEEVAELLFSKLEKSMSDGYEGWPMHWLYKECGWDDLISDVVAKEEPGFLGLIVHSGRVRLEEDRQLGHKLFDDMRTAAKKPSHPVMMFVLGCVPPSSFDNVEKRKHSRMWGGIDLFNGDGYKDAIENLETETALKMIYLAKLDEYQEHTEGYHAIVKDVLNGVSLVIISKVLKPPQQMKMLKWFLGFKFIVIDKKILTEIINFQGSFEMFVLLMNRMKEPMTSTYLNSFMTHAANMKFFGAAGPLLKKAHELHGQERAAQAEIRRLAGRTAEQVDEERAAAYKAEFQARRKKDKDKYEKMTPEERRINDKVNAQRNAITLIENAAQAKFDKKKAGGL